MAALVVGICLLIAITVFVLRTRLTCRHPYAYQDQTGNRITCRWCRKCWTLPCDHPQEQVKTRTYFNHRVQAEHWCTHCGHHWETPWPENRK